MELTDDTLKKEIIVTKEERIRPLRDTGSGESYEYPTYKNMQNTADWIVTKFCRICPHRGI